MALSVPSSAWDRILAKLQLRNMRHQTLDAEL